MELFLEWFIKVLLFGMIIFLVSILIYWSFSNGIEKRLLIKNNCIMTGDATGGREIEYKYICNGKHIYWSHVQLKEGIK